MSSLLAFNRVYRLENVWRFSEPCWYFRPPSCELLPLYLLSDLPHPSPTSQSKYTVYTEYTGVQTVWTVGEGGGGVGLCCRPYSAGEKHSVSDQIQNLPNCYTTPKKHQERRHLRHRRTPCPKFEAWNWIRRIFWMMLQYNANLSLSSSESPTALTN